MLEVGNFHFKNKIIFNSEVVASWVRLIGETEIKLPEVGTLSIYERKNTVKPRRIMKNS